MESITSQQSELFRCPCCFSTAMYVWPIEENGFSSTTLIECAACVDRKSAELRDELQLENDSIGG